MNKHWLKFKSEVDLRLNIKRGSLRIVKDFCKLLRLIAVLVEPHYNSINCLLWNNVVTYLLRP